jgi:predicted dehydrogenase
MTNPKEEYGAGDARTTVLDDAGAATGIAPTRRPRLGFLGVGWIGRHRMHAIARSGFAEVAALGDASAAVVHEAVEMLEQGEAPARCATLDELLNEDLDGLVIATPSALHANQAITALERGIAVFCQKPLARTAEETRRVVDAARANDRLLGVDLSYRHTEGMRCIRELVQQGELGRIYAVDLVFHNAYGPGKAWFYDRALSGGGCVIDLGIHLVDLALWTLGFPEVEDVDSRLYSKGELVRPPAEVCEDHAVARLDTADGTTIRLACSWNLPAGRDAVIEASFFGTQGGAAMRNVNGSFYDFVAERYRGTAAETLASPPDEWGGRAAVAWARQLAADRSFDPDVEHLVAVAATLDAVYGR